MVLIDEARLDQLRLQADPEGDALAAHYLGRDPADLFHAVVASKAGGDQLLEPKVAAWLADRPALPPWADVERMRHGAHFFNTWGLQLGLGLFLHSLPLAYASHDGAQVLALTSELETNAKRRVLETAQFVLDITRTGALEPGGQGYDSARRVRLVHAGVRQLIATDTRIPKRADVTGGPHWDPNWAAPINQEHLLGAMISWSSSLLHVLDRLHITYNESAASDYCHLWNIAGWLLGIDPAILPIERGDLDRLEVLIRQRNEKASAEGVALTKALLDLVRSFIWLPPLRGLPVAGVRLFCGDETSDLLGVPNNNWTRHLMPLLKAPRRRFSFGLARVGFLRLVVRRLTRTAMRGFVRTERGHDRPQFAIPVDLGIKVPKA